MLLQCISALQHCNACRYNELVLAGTFKKAPPPLNRAQAFLDAQDDVATRRFVVRADDQQCLLQLPLPATAMCKRASLSLSSPSLGCLYSGLNQSAVLQVWMFTN
jgi:hypothetical protein